MISIATKSLHDYTFVDLFAGIGGFHYALATEGAKCVMASEWDKYSAHTYFENFGIEPLGDITKIEYVGAVQLSGFKTDVQGTVQLKEAIGSRPIPC